MANPFLGQITLFAGNFAPRAWAFCDGQLLPIASNSALFSILGTTYGGDGRTTFALPDLRSRVPVHAGRGPGLSDYRLGQRGGVEQTVLTQLQLPQHSHIMGATTAPVPVASTMSASGEEGDKEDAGGNALGSFSGGYVSQAPDEAMAAGTVTSSIPAGTAIPAQIGNAGASQSVDLRQPFLAINYIIAMQGIFPSRN
jgi:microcystin-dependent protein